MNGQELIDQASALVASIHPAAVPAAEVPAVLARLNAHAQLAQAAVLALLRHAEALNIPSTVGAAHPTPWAAGILKISTPSVRHLHNLGNALAKASVIAGAFAEGRVTSEQARMMATTAAVLPSGSEPEILARGEDLGPDELRGVLRELEEELDPLGAQQREEDAAERSMERAQARRRVHLSRLDGENLVHINGYLDTVAAASFLAALDALCAPRNRTALGIDATDGEPDLRTAGQRRHDAICEIGNRIQATGTLPDHGGDRPQATLTVPYETLLDEAHGLGYLDDGTVLTPSACRLMACDARILPVVMGGASLPLDLGRTRRLFTGAIRRALNIRDRGCAFPGCDRGVPWTEAHHCTPWHQGGASDLSNGVLVCGHHHRLLHHSDWRVYINPTDGHPDFFAPHDDRPRRNHYHRRP